jgi:CheY-like chemotaxis protein
VTSGCAPGVGPHLALALIRDGFDDLTARFARRMLDLRHDTPIVRFTRYSAALSPNEARAAGFRAVLETPMSLAVLVESLHRALPEPTA